MSLETLYSLHIAARPQKKTRTRTCGTRKRHRKKQAALQRTPLYVNVQYTIAKFCRITLKFVFSCIIQLSCVEPSWAKGRKNAMRMIRKIFVIPFMARIWQISEWRKISQLILCINRFFVLFMIELTLLLFVFDVIIIVVQKLLILSDFYLKVLLLFYYLSAIICYMIMILINFVAIITLFLISDLILYCFYFAFISYIFYWLIL